MITVPPPQKPFPGYKWRWAVLTPTESLNDPAVYLGVLRVFYRNQNQAPSSPQVINELRIVQEETNSNVNLVRSSDRNIIRNSGQYWKALGLLEERHGLIALSRFGSLLAEGKITQVEFATTIVKTLELPNARIETTLEWENANLKIRPLQLILDILSNLERKQGSVSSYITPTELIKIIIPLAGVQATLDTHVKALIQFRDGLININEWPNCAPSDNDPRMAREFLLFLSNYGFCKRIKEGRGRENEKFYLASISVDEVVELHNVDVSDIELEKVVSELRMTQIPANIERKKVLREVLERPFQVAFRKNILNAFNFKCVVTGVTIETVLEASHIIPVSERGSDNNENGLCLRSDIHQLFDSNHLKILPTGEILLSETASLKNNYALLPRKIILPEFINTEFLNWRNKYY